MSNKIIITAESTCDLTPELSEKYDVKILPLYVTLNDKSFLDMVDITPDEIYKNYYENKTIPTTSAIPPSEFIDFFSPFVNDGYEVVHLCLSSCFSSCYQNACIAAEELGNVHVINSMNLSTGFGHLVINACELRDQGLSGAEIKEKIDTLVSKVNTSFIIDNLEFLHKGGRCSSIAMLGANLLKLKPCIELTDGKMDVGKKYRGKLSSVLEEYVADKLIDADVDSRRIFITHSGISQELIDIVYNKVKSYNIFDEILITRAGCTISTHCGPNTLGILFITK